MRVDEKFMEEVGVGVMPQEEKQAFMKHAEEELEVRVGQGIGKGLTEEQLEEFDQIKDVEKAAEWLEQYVPNYRSIVEKVYEGFKQELIAERQSILGM